MRPEAPVLERLVRPWHDHTMLNTDHAIEQLDRLFSETWHRPAFTVLSRGHETAITILDGGPRLPSHRYWAKATAEDGREASGDPAETIETALQIVHWNKIGLRLIAGKLESE